MRPSIALAQSVIKKLQEPISVKAGLTAVGAWWMRHAGIARDTVTPNYFKEKLLAIDFVAEGDGFHVRCKDAAGSPKAQIARTGGDLRRFLKEFLGSKPRMDRITGSLWLLPSDFVQKRMALPAAARASLEEAVGYQIDVETPFRSSEIYYGVRVISETPVAIGVELHAVLKSAIDAMIAKIESSGILVEKVYSCSDADDPTPVLLLSRPAASTRKVRRRILMQCAFAASAVVALAIGPLGSKALEAARLGERAEADMREAAPIVAAHRNLAEKQSSRGRLAGITQRFSDPLQVLLALTQSIPTDTWLTRFAMHDGEIQISGLTPSTSILIDQLARAELFSAPAYAAPTTLDPTYDRERFVLDIRLRPSL
jgi:general secretion pathway protein L